MPFRIFGIIALLLFTMNAAAQVSTSVTVTSSTANATLGSPVTFTAAVTPVQATGKITFYSGTSLRCI